MNPYILFTVKGLDGIGIEGETYEIVSAFEKQQAVFQMRRL